MTDHVRKQIRVAAAAALDAAVEITATVYTSRVHSLATEKLPVILVYTTEEASERFAMGDSLQREVTLQVVGAVENTTGFDNDADELAAQIERALGVDATLGGLAKDLVLDATTIELVGDGDKPTGTVTLEYTAVYVTAASDPSNNL